MREIQVAFELAASSGAREACDFGAELPNIVDHPVKRP